MIFWFRLFFCAAARLFIWVLSFSFLMLSVLTASENKQSVLIELNRVDDVDSACRISLVGTNKLDVTIKRLVLELVLFDQEGTVERFMRLAIPEIRASGLRAVQFDIKGQPCAGFGRFLINDVVACDGIDVEFCRAALMTTTRVPIEFLSPNPFAAQPKE